MDEAYFGQTPTLVLGYARFVKVASSRIPEGEPCEQVWRAVRAMPLRLLERVMPWLAAKLPEARVEAMLATLAAAAAPSEAPLVQLLALWAARGRGVHARRSPEPVRPRTPPPLPPTSPTSPHTTPPLPHIPSPLSLQAITQLRLFLGGKPCPGLPDTCQCAYISSPITPPMQQDLVYSRLLPEAHVRMWGLEAARLKLLTRHFGIDSPPYATPVSCGMPSTGRFSGHPAHLCTCHFLTFRSARVPAMFKVSMDPPDPIPEP